jgi:DNA-binding transcriptional LysR family regulator
MEINELRYFLAVAKTENIHRASEEIGISPGSLSKAISKLENELKVKLFNRMGRGISLSFEGKFLKQKANEIINLEMNAKIEILGQKTSFKALIGGNETLLSYFGREIGLQIFNLYDHSQIELVPIESSLLTSKLKDGEIHLALSTEKLSDDFQNKKIADVKFHTVVGKGHPLFHKAKNNKEINIDEILTYHFISPKNSILGKTTELQSNDGWRDDKFPRKKPFTTSSLKTLESFVASGKTLAYLPDYMIVNSSLEILNIIGCPYQCKQQIYLSRNNKNEIGWINQIF